MTNVIDIISIQFYGTCPNCNSGIKVPIVNHHSDLDVWVLTIQCPNCSFEFERSVIK